MKEADGQRKLSTENIKSLAIAKAYNEVLLSAVCYIEGLKVYSTSLRNTPHIPTRIPLKEPQGSTTFYISNQKHNR